MDMLTKFFANNENNVRPQDIGTKWYLKPHAKNEFFSWLNQWSIFVKKPSDLGFSDERYKLPELIENKVFVKNEKNWIINGQIMLFNGVAQTMSEVREEQKGTFKERCEKEDAEKADNEIAEKQNNLKRYALDSKQITKAELETEDFKTIISELNETKLKSIIADRYIASFNNDVAEDTSNDETNTATASLEVDEVNESPSSFMTKFLLNK